MLYDIYILTYKFRTAELGLFLYQIISITNVVFLVSGNVIPYFLAFKPDLDQYGFY
jgi:hypothetical protein